MLSGRSSLLESNPICITFLLMEGQSMKTKTNGTRKRQPLELYIHVPFCIRKCHYCDFLSAPAGDQVKERYFDALLREIRSYEGRMDGYGVGTIFIGGGTPSCVDAGYLKRTLDTIREVFPFSEKEPVEITLEVNPGTIDRDKLIIYREAGINRLSFGLQSTLEQELRLLGRIHDYQQFEDNYFLARSLCFNNINVDLMSALPGQTLKDWEITLNRVAELKPEHISAYSLIIEEGTPFYERYRDGGPEADRLPEEETDRRMYARTKEILEDYGYHRYEISNYSREGFECRHNKGYWTGVPYLGLGLGSSSCLMKSRFHNTDRMDEYLDACTELCKIDENAPYEGDGLKTQGLPEDRLGIRRELQPLSRKDQMEEFMFLGLRLLAGIEKKEFIRRFGQPIEEIYGEIIHKLLAKGLLEERGDSLRLTDYGIDVSNLVLAEFMLD